VRSTDRSRFFFPLLSSIALYGIYRLLEYDPRILPRLGDLSAVFGKDLVLLRFAVYIPVVLLLVRVFDTLVFDLAMARRRGVSAPPLLRDVVALILYLLLFASLFTTIFNYDLRTLLGGGALLAAVLGLALQDTLGNLISGIALHMEDSFEVSDVIKSGEFMGRVEDVSWRATKVRTYSNSVVMLPNSLLARERLEVFPSGNPNGRALALGIDYHFAPARVIEVLQRAASHVDGVDRELPCFARVAGFGDSSVTYEVKYFTRDYMQRDRIDADIRKAVWYALSGQPRGTWAYRMGRPCRSRYGTISATPENVDSHKRLESGAGARRSTAAPSGRLTRSDVDPSTNSPGWRMNTSSSLISTSSVSSS